MPTVTSVPSSQRNLTIFPPCGASSSVSTLSVLTSASDVSLSDDVAHADKPVGDLDVLDRAAVGDLDLEQFHGFLLVCNARCVWRHTKRIIRLVQVFELDDRGSCVVDLGLAQQLDLTRLVDDPKRVSERGPVVLALNGIRIAGEAVPYPGHGHKPRRQPTDR